MKYSQLLIGFLLGAILGFGLTTFRIKSKQPTVKNPPGSADSVYVSSKWRWPDSLDAIRAAPENHQLVYEDKNLRVLAVVLNGKKSEPIHTHKWKSIMWISKPIVPCQINNFQKANNGKWIKSDSLLIQKMPVNIGQLTDPEGPTSISNFGSENGLAYRVEFKREFRP
jgi:hypothetical protein